MENIYLTQEQIAIIQDYLNRGPNADGNYSDAYEYIASILPDSDVKLWFDGAAQANAGKGVFSEIIRVYSRAQMELRGVPYSDALMQAASNRVAERALEDILKPERKQADGSYEFLTIRDIANNDAVGVGEILFAGLGSDDTAGGIRNSAWAGAILFSAFGSDQTGRLLSAGDTVQDPSDATQLNRLDDMKNVLFAYYAYGEAIASSVWQAFENFGDLFTEFDIQFFTDIGIGIEALSTLYSSTSTLSDFMGKAGGLILNQLTGLIPESAVLYGELIEEVGVEQVLAWIESAYRGYPSNAVSETDFVTHANIFFSELTPQFLNETPVSLLPQKKSEIVALARNSEHVRNALMSLSPIVIEKSGYPTDLSLYDPVTGTGALTEQWLDNRSSFFIFEMLYRKSGDTDGSFEMSLGLPFLNLGDIHYVDHTANNSYELYVDGIDFGLVPTKKIIFGGNGNETLSGEEGDDRLFGAGGNDTLRGRAGDDYLDGGQGNDTYIFNTGDGSDTVRDGVGANSLIINGRTVSSLTPIAVDSNIYQELDAQGNSIDGSIYTLTDGRLLINVGGEGAGDIIDIITYDKDTNNFGLSFNDVDVSQPPPLSEAIIVGNGTITVQTPDGPEEIEIGRRYDSVNRDADRSYIYDASLYEPNYPSPDDDPDSFAPYRFDGNDQNDILTGAVHPHIVGYVGTDFLDGREGDDVIYGDNPVSGVGDDDVLTGGKGSDQLFGGLGNDHLIGWNDRLVPFTGDSQPAPEIDPNRENSGDEDYLNGGDGNDILVAGRGDDTLIGGEGNDFINGNVGNDKITGDGGDDYINADSYVVSSGQLSNFYLAPDLHLDTENQQMFNDIIDGGEGNDIIHGEAGEDIVNGGEGNDFLYGDRVNHKEFHRLDIIGAAGQVEESDESLNSRYSDLAVQYHGDDLLIGGGGEDRIFGSGGNDVAYGGQGEDYLFGDDVVLASEHHGEDTLDGGEDDDVLIGGGGTDKLNGGDGDDFLYGDDGPKSQTNVGGTTVFGPPIYTVNGHKIKYTVESEHQLQDFLYGGSGSDHLYGHGGDDTLDGGADDDYIDGGSGNDTLIGGEGTDSLEGGSGEDILIGGEGTDYLKGGNGEDTLNGGAGNDVLNGGEGKDIYMFSGAGGTDSIDDDSIGKIAISGAITDVWQESDVTYISYGGSNFINLINNSVASVESFALNGTEINIFDYLNFANTSQVKGTSGDNVIRLPDATQVQSVHGNAGNDAIYGADGNDLLWGDAGDDVLEGGEGRDNLVGGDGDDVLRGGTGVNDQLKGQAGNDTYLFGAGDGDTFIYNEDSNPDRHDVLRFLEGIDPTDVQVSRSFSNLLLSLESTGETIMVTSVSTNKSFHLKS